MALRLESNSNPNTNSAANTTPNPNHLIAMPAPVTNLRHQSNMRGFFHYMIQLNPPIFLNVELSRSFILEYPVCGKEKNIVMPYPSTG
jgi:hypothetical protein